MVRLVGVEPTTGKSPADFKPAAYANFATAAPGVYAAIPEYHAPQQVSQQIKCALLSESHGAQVMGWISPALNRRNVLRNLKNKLQAGSLWEAI